MRKLIHFWVIAIVFWGSAAPAFAHVLKTDNAIGAVMHVTPDDDPVAGDDTTFFFDIKDKNNKFNSQACECTVTIFKGSEQIKQADLYQSGGTGGLETPLFTYVFPQRGIYVIQISGKPKIADAFQAFTIKYDLRVDKENKAKVAATSPGNNNAAAPLEHKQNHALHYILLGGAALVIVYLVIKNKKKKKQSTNKNSSTLSCFIVVLLLFGFTLHMTGLASVLCHSQGHTISTQGHACCNPETAILTPRFEGLPIFSASSVTLKQVTVLALPRLQTIANKSPPYV